MAIYDSQAIQKILPHRYPFLLVDKITELDWNPHEHLPATWFKDRAKEMKIEAGQSCSVCHR